MALVEQLARLALGRRLPVVTGTLEVEGLGGSIQILRDGFGVPTIDAENLRDATFGLGFATAQDRSFQLEFARRAREVSPEVDVRVLAPGTSTSVPTRES